MGFILFFSLKFSGKANVCKLILVVSITPLATTHESRDFNFLDWEAVIKLENLFFPFF